MASVRRPPGRPARLEALLAATGRLASAATLPAVLDGVLDAAIDLGGADFAAVWLARPSGGGVRLEAVRGLDRDRLERELPTGEELAGAVLRSDAPASARAYRADRRTSRWLADELGVGSALAVPLRGRERSVGVLTAWSRRHGHFSATRERLLLGLAEHAGLAVDRVRTEAERDDLWERFLQAQKMAAVGRLASGVAHDFNNLLTIISGYAELALVGIAPDDPNREFAEEISAASQQASTVTRHLLLFNRQLPAAPAVLDLNQTIGEMEKLLRRVVGETVDLVVAPEPGLWPVKVDPGRVEQVLLSLVVEAGDVLAEGGRLTIATANVQPDPLGARHGVGGARSGPHVALTVAADAGTGAGLRPPAEAGQGKWLEPRPEGTRPSEASDPGRRSGSHPEAGLGLAAVGGIVEAAGGELRTSGAPGRGVTFEVRLPRSEEAPLPAEAGPPVGDLPKGSERILVVEDEDQLRSLMARLLKGCGYAVMACAGGVEALRIAARHAGPIDLLVTDVVMPDLSGPEVAGYLKADRPKVRTLYVSGYTEPAITERAGLDASAPFLSKPFTPAALAAKVREVLDL
jgi:signal transduction histidine kinase/CheY-like chemotaxis protein